MGRFSSTRASRRDSSLIATTLATLLVPLWVGAVPLTFLVGSDGACDFSTVQGAINAAAANPGFDEIRIARNSNYVAQALTVGSQVLDITGGYATCASAAPSGSTTLSGAGGGADSVLTITGTGNDVILTNLAIIRGDEVSDGYGGGIDFRAAGFLTLRETSLSQNYAGYGGGINFSGDGGEAELRLETGSVILNNVAQFSGGGLRIRGSAVVHMLADNSQISSNEALGMNPISNQPEYGYGGGIEVIAPAVASIGSPGLGSTGAIYNNRARYGGGIAVLGEGGNGDFAVGNLFTTNPTRPVRVHGNVASVGGGGVYAKPNSQTLPDGVSRAYFCATNFRIDENNAQEGAAMYADVSTDGVQTSEGATLLLNSGCVGGIPAASVACAAGVACNTIDGNVAQTTSGVATTGATIRIDANAKLEARRFRARHNRGGQVLRTLNEGVAGQGEEARLFTCLIADNVVSGHLLLASGDTDLSVDDCTIANNTISAPHVIEATDNLILRHSILAQPGKTSATVDGTRTIENVIASERLSLDGGNSPTVVEADPRFIDPGAGDYRLRAGSPAIDFAPAVSGDDRDLDSLPRDLDLPIHFNRTGVRDLGAYERQDLLPLVLNGNFDRDDRLWDVGIPGISARDPADNISGFPGSGSMAIDFVNPPGFFVRRINVRQQCIHLPGPGFYILDGYGHTVPGSAVQSQSAILHWQFRSNGDETCSNIGDVDMFGEFVVGNGPAWGQPNELTGIEVTEAMWTSNSSISVALLVELSGTLTPTTHLKAWFDGIVLIPGIPTEELFDDGFEGIPN